MKCANCGAELRTGCLYCSNCGKEAQIVPDYDLFEDEDYFNSLVNEQAKPEITQKPAEDLSNINQQKRRNTIIISSIVGGITLLCIIGIIVSSIIKNRNYNSLDYQVSHAEEAMIEGNYTAAVKFYERALEIDKDNNDIKLRLADVYCLRQDVKSAIILYQEVATDDPGNIKAYSRLIEIYDENKDYDSIIALMNDTKDSKVIELFEPYVVADVRFSKQSGNYNDFFEVSMESSPNTKIYYTLDGSDPKSGIVYNSPIRIDKEGEYKIIAIAKNDKGLYSNPVEVNYVVSIAAPDYPSVSPDGGIFTDESDVYINVPAGCTAYYTWDSTDPTVNSSKYTGPMSIPEGNNILSVIIIDNATGKCSDVYRGHFEYYS